jgi:hypothetical protein
MKKPRIEDFDPNAAPTLGSPMDDLPKIGRPAQTPPDEPMEKPTALERSALSEELPADEAPIRTPVRPSVRTDQRTLTRMPFEIYRDQHASLKQFSLDEQSQGEKGSMSQMVREALDEYIAKRRKRS